MKTVALASILAFGLLVSGAAYATDAAAPAATPTPGMTPAAAGKLDAAAKKEKSEKCYKEADVKGLHGKERKKFHRECMKADAAKG